MGSNQYSEPLTKVPDLPDSPKPPVTPNQPHTSDDPLATHDPAESPTDTPQDADKAMHVPTKQSAS